MGYNTKTEVTGHGFRAMARTMIVQDLGIEKVIVERHLAHASDEILGDAYDRAEYVAQRRVMAQAWANYLDRLERGQRGLTHNDPMIKAIRLLNENRDKFNQQVAATLRGGPRRLTTKLLDTPAHSILPYRICELRNIRRVPSCKYQRTTPSKTGVLIAL